MNRRRFISQSAAISILGAMGLSGCGGGGGGSQSDTPTTRTTATDESVGALRRKNESLQGTMGALGNAIDDTLSSDGTRSFSLRGIQKSGGFFAEHRPMESYFGLNEDVWTSYRDYYRLMGRQYEVQFQKMAAAMRYAGFRSNGESQTRAVSLRAEHAARVTLRETDTSALDTFDDLVSQLAQGDFTATILNLLTVSMGVLKETIALLLDQDKLKGLAYAVLTYLALDRLLETIKSKSLENLSFEGNDNIVISLGKMVIAALALFGLLSLQKLAPTAATRDLRTRGNDTASQEEIVTFLQNVVTQGRLLTVLFGYLTQVIEKVTEDTQTTANRLMQNLTDSGYTLTDEDNALIEKLKKRSKIMAIFGLAFKNLFALLSQSAAFKDSQGRFIGFESQGDAKVFDLLFGSALNPYDETFNQTMSDYLNDLSSRSDSGSLGLSEMIDALATKAYDFAIETSQEAYDFTTQTEHDAYTFASHLADLAYRFTGNTEEDAYQFASHMADLAYSFTMKIEDDAYQFALQGMEWGYLFASRGEEVGIMADRVLWMAVQIGQMADRIGEMADRIVYTEQLIVYTETLILDFGLLIYGGMKMIVNLVLTGMALILDRRWYGPETEDQIVTVIAEHVSHMMDDMQTYALKVLENQKALRQTTLSALDWILALEQGDQNATT